MSELISEYRVLKTPAGYYCGLQYFEPEGGYWGPYDRCSSYYATEAAAAADVSLQGQECCESHAELVAYNAYHNTNGNVHGDRVFTALCLFDHYDILEVA